MNGLLSKLKSVAKRVRSAEKRAKPVTEFEYSTLPWIDKQGPDIAAFVKRYPAAKELPYDLEEKILFGKIRAM